MRMVLPRCPNFTPHARPHVRLQGVVRLAILCTVPAASYDSKGAFGMGTAQINGELWGARAREWAELQEGSFGPVYQAAFKAAGVGPGSCVLDVGCGAGLSLQIARELGATVAGLDASAALLEVAKSRSPGADIRVGELEQLPFADRTFEDRKSTRLNS